jgi:hypothetical protein
MRLDWIYGLGATSTLALLVGLDLLLAVVEQKGAASLAVLKGMRAERSRR